MNQILRCDWLSERAKWSYLARSGLPALSRKKNFPKSHVINPLLTKLVRPRWLDIGLVRFCVFMDLDSVSVHKHAKKELGQYPAFLTSHLINNPYLLSFYNFIRLKDDFQSVLRTLESLFKFLFLDSCKTSQNVILRNNLQEPNSNFQLNRHNRAFSLTWPAHMQIYWNKRKCLHKKRVQLPQDWFGTPTWPPFHCFGTPIWLPRHHVKTLCRSEALDFF